MAERYQVVGSIDPSNAGVIGDGVILVEHDEQLLIAEPTRGDE